MLLNESPYIHVKKGELDKRAMGWVVVEVGRERGREGGRKRGSGPTPPFSAILFFLLLSLSSRPPFLLPSLLPSLPL